jgi:hypothetical protein
MNRHELVPTLVWASEQVLGLVRIARTRTRTARQCMQHVPSYMPCVTQVLWCAA